MSHAEDLKHNSRQMRGTLAEGLQSPASHFSDDDKVLLKFHGSYQADDRDKRPALLKAKQELAFNFTVRCKIPGGGLTAQQYLALDQMGQEWANGTLRITSRQDIQFHGVLKGNLKALVARINQIRLTTWGACGDVTRNVVAPPTPYKDAVHAEVNRLADEITEAFYPDKQPYLDLWLDGKKVSEAVAAVPDPLYGTRYLPRKFKPGIAVPPRNEVDIYTQDVGLVPYFPNGVVEGYTVLVGGGMGMDFGKLHTHPVLAQPLFYVAKADVLAVVRVIMDIFRDHGNREDRKQARLKYLIESKGMEWFRKEVESRLGRPVQEAKKFEFTTTADLMGWQAQGDGRFFYGLRVEAGRIKDGAVKYRSGIKAIMEQLQCSIRLSPNHSLFFCDVPEAQKSKLDQLLEQYGLKDSKPITAARAQSLACVGLPTCGLALSESERVYPQIMDGIDAVLNELGLANEPFLVRITGCPNGCVRPYVADIAFVGRGPGKYSVFAGGSHLGTRLVELIHKSVAIEELPKVVRPFLEQFVAQRQKGETFSAWWGRTHPESAIATPEQFHVEASARLTGGVKA